MRERGKKANKHFPCIDSNCSLERITPVERIRPHYSRAGLKKRPERSWERQHDAVIHPTFSWVDYVLVPFPLYLGGEGEKEGGCVTAKEEKLKVEEKMRRREPS